MSKTIIFIDGSNLYHSLKGLNSRTDLNFESFCRKLCAGRSLVRIYYYNAPVDQTKEPIRYKDQQKFFSQMRRVPYLELKLGRLIYRGSYPSVPPYEKGVDVLMSTDMLVHAFRGTFDELILVSGDTDFSDALQAVKDFGKHVEVALFPPLWSSQRLRDVADKVIEVTPDFLSDCWL